MTPYNQVWAETGIPARDGGVQSAAMLAHPELFIDYDATLARLRSSEERLRLFFEAAPFPMALHQPGGRYLQTNAAYQRMLGYSNEELLLLGAKGVTHPDDVAEGRRLFQELRDGKRDSYQREKRYRRRDGRVVWAISAASAARNSNQELEYIISMVEDITERKHLEEEVLLISARERQRIGKDLHDGLGQLLTGLALKARLLQEKLAERGEEGADDAAEIQQLAHKAATESRLLARGPSYTVHFKSDIGKPARIPPSSASIIPF